jgi:GNAT superfamily N-acetyltransferase
MVIEIRSADLADAPALVTLIAAMGYEVTLDQVRQRLSQLPPGHVVFVGADDVRVRGWCHVFLSHSLIVGPRVEIAGLAVEAGLQRSGVGGALLRHAEEWARQHGVDIVYLRSGTERGAAHDFYLKHGYRLVKSQVALTKTLI